MSIRFRVPLPKDIRRCVEIVAEHPILGPRYASAIADLPEVLLSLLGRDACLCAVFEQFDGHSARLLGSGIATFVSDEFVREVKTPPSFWAVPEIVRRIKGGDSPILTDREVREANSKGGLNVFSWHTGCSVEDMQRAEVNNAVAGAFVELCRGFLLKETLTQVETWQHFCGICAMGTYIVNPADGRYVQHFGAVEEDVIRVPLTGGLTRDLAHEVSGSWLASLFHYESPRFGLSRSQQRLLQAALTGCTDDELSDELGISIFAVKNAWRRIYDRVGRHLVGSVRGELESDGKTPYRGKQRRHHLLAYLREHPEELRPFSRKPLLQRGLHSRPSLHSRKPPDSVSRHTS